MATQVPFSTTRHAAWLLGDLVTSAWHDVRAAQTQRRVESHPVVLAWLVNPARKLFLETSLERHGEVGDDSMLSLALESWAPLVDAVRDRVADQSSK